MSAIGQEARALIEFRLRKKAREHFVSVPGLAGGPAGGRGGHRAALRRPQPHQEPPHDRGLRPSLPVSPGAFLTEFYLLRVS